MKNILIIRSSSLLFEKILNQLSSRDVSITALAPASVNQEQLRRQGVHEVITLKGSGQFRLRDIFNYKKKLAGKEFDEVICLYNNEKGSGYFNVDLFAFLTPAKNRFAYNYSREILELNRSLLCRKLFDSLLGEIWFALNGLVSLIVYLIILAGMLLVEVLFGLVAFESRKKGQEENP